MAALVLHSRNGSSGQNTPVLPMAGEEPERQELDADGDCYGSRSQFRRDRRRPPGAFCLERAIDVLHVLWRLGTHRTRHEHGWQDLRPAVDAKWCFGYVRRRDRKQYSRSDGAENRIPVLLLLHRISKSAGSRLCEDLEG